MWTVPEGRKTQDADLLQELYSTGLLVGFLVDSELAQSAFPIASSRSWAG
jgi:hypothetical protein